MRVNLNVGVGYRVDAINPRRTRVSVMYAVDPKGRLAFFPSLVREYEQNIVQSVLCLRTLVNQLPECAVLNLVESIIKSMRVEPEPEPSPCSDLSPESSVTVSSSLPSAPLEGPKENCWEEIDGTIWKVRSSSYIQTHEKTPSHPSMCTVTGHYITAFIECISIRSELGIHIESIILGQFQTEVHT